MNGNEKSVTGLIILITLLRIVGGCFIAAIGCYAGIHFLSLGGNGQGALTLCGISVLFGAIVAAVDLKVS